MGLLTNVKRAVYHVGFKAREKSPEILLISGTIGVGITLFNFGKAVLKFQPVLQKHNERLQKLKDLEIAKKEGVEITKEAEEMDVKKARTSVYLETFKDAALIFGPSFLLGTASVSCFWISNGIMRARYLGLGAAYAAKLAESEHLESAVLAKYGADELAKLKSADDETIIESHVDEETGETVVDSVTRKSYSAYSKIFDETNVNYEKDPERNRFFLQGKQNWANQLLVTRGYLLLNEVYQMLDFEPTKAGYVMGWIHYKDSKEALANGSQNYVDFGIFNTSRDANRRFVNGYETSVVLDFNVDKMPIIERLNIPIR